MDDGMSVAAKIEVCFFTLLVMMMAGCDGAIRRPVSAEPIMLRNIACKKTSESGSTVIGDCTCNAPVFAFNAKTGKQEIQCAGATK
jgi:hypothetical protein